MEEHVPGLREALEASPEPRVSPPRPRPRGLENERRGAKASEAALRERLKAYFALINR